MGRRLQVDECMICGSLPCTCFTKKTTKKVPVPPKTEPKPEPQPVKSLSAPVKLRNPPAPVKVRKLVVETTQQDEDLHQALRVLAACGLMGQDDREKYAIILRSGNPVQDRAAAWRARREVRNNARSIKE